MKFNILRSLFLPWIVFFVFALSFSIFAHVQWSLNVTEEPLFHGYLALSSLICIFFNIRSLRLAGIWMAYSLPLSLKYSSWPWVARAVGAVAIALGAHTLGSLKSMPLMWNGIIAPAVIAFALIFFIRSLVGIILKKCANLTLGRTLAFTLSTPLFVLLPLSLFFLAHNITHSYDLSRALPDLTLIEGLEDFEAQVANLPAPIPDENLEQLLALKDNASGCQGARALIAKSLSPAQPEKTVLAALPLISCSGLPSVISLQRLLDLMLNHPASTVRVKAIERLPNYGNDQVRRIAYLVLKKITAQETDEVITAATRVMIPAGEVERSLVQARLKRMMANEPLKAGVASRILIKNFGLEMDVKELIRAEFNDLSKPPLLGISMICSLSQVDQQEFHPYLDRILKSLERAPENLTLLGALECIGEPAKLALQAELTQPKNLSRLTATRTLERFEIAFDQGLVQTLRQCTRDADVSVRESCSRNLARMGSPALPTIVDLLRSGNPLAKESGRNALKALRDPSVKEELMKIGQENSGWMATQEKLEVAKAARLALKQLENQKSTIK